MLKQRVITALVLLLILLPALFYSSPWPFCALALVLIAAGAWEWGRMNGLGPSASIAAGLLCAVLCALAWSLGTLEQAHPVMWSVTASAWVLVSAALLLGGVGTWSRVPVSLRCLLGLTLLVVAWLAVAQARVLGTNYLLSVMALVWAADIFAYFAGRTWGGRWVAVKLAPSISPGKSWEGVAGGLVGVLLLALLWRWADAHWGAAVPSWYSRVAVQGWGVWLACVVFMLVMSVVGDLIESLVKRSAGVKDSSGLLPGHGGVLDRIDALLPTVPLAMMLQTWATTA